MGGHPLRRYSIWAAVVLAAATAAAEASAPRLGLVSAPSSARANVPAAVTISVTGRAARPTVWIRLRGSTRSFATRATRRRGHYRASVVFPRAGRWSLGARVGKTSRRLRSVTVRAAAPQLTIALDVTVMPDGSLLVSDLSNRVFRARPGGPLTVVAGNGELGHDGDGGPAVRARVGFPVEVARDPRGGFALVSGERWVRRVGEDGVIRTIAELASPTALAFDAAGNLFVSELGGRIRRVDAGTGAVTTFAGIGGEGYGGDGGPAVAAQLNRPHGLAVAADGTVYVCDTFNNRIRRIGPDGVITTLATGLNSPDLELAPDGSLYAADFGNNRIARVSRDGAVSTVASAAGPNAVAVDAAGLVYFTERGLARIRRVDPSTGAVTTVLGR